MSGPHVCTQASHAALKADPDAFAALRFAFVQRYEAGSDGNETWAAYDLHARHCVCGSTLAVEVPVRTCRRCEGCGVVGVDRGPRRSPDSETCGACAGAGEVQP